MKRYIITFIFISLVSFAFAFDNSVNLLQNGNFFNGLTGWDANDTGGTIWVEDDVCHISAGTSSSSWSYYTCSVSQTLKLSPGKYKCSFNYLGSFSDGGGYKIFRIITSDDPTIDTNDTYLINETKTKEENFSPEYSFTLFEDKYVMIMFSLMVHYGNMTLSNCDLTRELMFLEPEAKSCEREYGDNNPNFEVIYNGMIAGDESLLENNLKVELSCDANKLSSVGTYPIKITVTGEVPGYEIKGTKNGDLEVKSAPITVSCDNMQREYGEDNPIPIINYTGFKNEQTESVLTKKANYQIEASPNSNVGTYKIQLFGAEAPNYSFEYKEAYLNIIKAPLSAKINDAERIYGVNNPSFSISFYGLRNDENSPSWVKQPKFQTEANVFSNVGEYEVGAIEYEATNYNIEQIETGLLTILPAELIISGINQSRLYYETNPEFTYKVSGYKNDDNSAIITVAPTLYTEANLNSNTGKYDIILSDAKLSTNNYNIVYQNSILTINPRNLLVSVGNYERPYGQENPKFQLEYQGFVNNQNIDVLISEPEPYTNANITSNVGNYTINISGGEALNYIFTYTSGNLTIIKADQTINWSQDLTNLSVGQQVELTAYASSGLPITYDTGDSSICEIYSVGDKKYLDCIKEGEVQIRASQQGNSNYNATTRTSKQVIIKGKFVSAESITLNQNHLNLNVNESVQLTVKIEPSNATQTVFWSSSNYAIATVSEDGLVTGISEGNATITVSNGEISAICNVEVLSNAGINDIYDEYDDIEVYNLQGVKMNVKSRKELNKLQRGIYIINGRKEYVK